MGDRRIFENYNFSSLRAAFGGRDIDLSWHCKFDFRHLKIYEYVQLFVGKSESRSKNSVTNPQGELMWQVFWCDNLEIHYLFHQFCPKSCNFVSQTHNSKAKTLTRSSFDYKREYLIICTNFTSNTKFMKPVCTTSKDSTPIHGVDWKQIYSKIGINYLRVDATSQ